MCYGVYLMCRLFVYGSVFVVWLLLMDGLGGLGCVV